MPEALRRPRGLPPPPPGRRLTHVFGDGLIRDQTAANALASIRFVGRLRATSTLLARDLTRACPPLSGPSLSCPQPQQIDP
jgi:hypothetical protein